MAAVQFAVGQTPTAKPGYSDLFVSVWETVNERFYDPEFNGVDWKAVGERYRPLAAKAKTDAEFHGLMQKMLGELPVSHLGLGMPGQQGHIGIGVRTHNIDGRQTVTFVHPGSDAQRRGIRTGDVFLDASRVSGPLGSNAEIRLRGCDGRTRTIKVRRESHSQPERPSIRWRTFIIGEGERIGYLRAVRFDDDVAPSVDRAMGELKDTKGLIIDVRDNTGGNMSFIRLSSYLSSGEHLVAALLTRHYLEAKGHTPGQIDPTQLPRTVGSYTNEKIYEAMKSNGGAVSFFSEDLGERKYSGKVVVLINDETASAAEGFAWHMKLMTAATLVGRKTAGALLGAEYFTLPGGWRLAVPTHSGWGPDGKPVIDQPVVPHIETEWTANDVCSGTDPDLAKALDIIAGDN